MPGFFEQFKREKGEELQAYIVRQQTMLRKLKELQVEVPPLLAGWHMLSRAGVPRWTHPQIKALCGGELNVKGVAKAMTRMFGGDSKPNLKDSALRGADINMAETYKHYYEYDDVDEAYYQSYDEDEIYMDDYEEVDYTNEEEEPPPPELDEALIATEEAYISYLDSRKKMRELALARGFFPLLPSTWVATMRKARKVVEEKEKEKEKGGKNNNATKGKGKSFVPPGAKRFAFVRRNSGRVSTTSSTTARSTTSGSTSSHGPRFKRYRLPASGIKEVPDEANMVTELDVTDLEVRSNVIEEIHYTMERKLVGPSWTPAPPRRSVELQSGTTLWSTW